MGISPFGSFSLTSSVCLPVVICGVGNNSSLEADFKRVRFRVGEEPCSILICFFSTSALIGLDVLGAAAVTLRTGDSSAEALMSNILRVRRF